MEDDLNCCNEEEQGRRPALDIIISKLQNCFICLLLCLISSVGL